MTPPLSPSTPSAMILPVCSSRLSSAGDPLPFPREPGSSNNESGLFSLRCISSNPGLSNWCGDSTMRISEGTKRSEEHTSELQSRSDLVCRLLLEKKKKKKKDTCEDTSELS